MTSSSILLVDNDPHFIVVVKGIDEGICFDVDGEPGDIYQLIYDKVTGRLVHYSEGPKIFHF